MSWIKSSPICAVLSRRESSESPVEGVIEPQQRRDEGTGQAGLCRSYCVHSLTTKHILYSPINLPPEKILQNLYVKRITLSNTNWIRIVLHELGNTSKQQTVSFTFYTTFKPFWNQGNIHVMLSII